MSAYNCCINSCCCFLGKYQDFNICPYCNEPRYNAHSDTKQVFCYTPLEPKLHGLFQSQDMATKVGYWAELEEDYDPNIVEDVFHGQNYCTLREAQLVPGREYCIFQNAEDIALGISTDGFTLFKRRCCGLSTAWPIILVNHNLHPRIRTRLQNVLCVGMITDLGQPKDLNLFLIPLLEELLDLEDGICSTGLTPEGQDYNLDLHAFVILGFGNIPAVTKLLLAKAHNALTLPRVLPTRCVVPAGKEISLLYPHN
jgi:hypothetical protein